MNIPEIKNELKPPARGEESKAIHAEARLSAEGAKTHDLHAVGKLEKTADQEKQHSRLNREKAEQIAHKAEAELAAKNLKLKFNVIEESNTIQVEVRDANDKVIKKIPADDIVKLSKSIRKHFQGSFVDKTF